MFATEHHLARPKGLDIIIWLLHCIVVPLLPVLKPETWLLQGITLIVAMPRNTQIVCPKNMHEVRALLCMKSTVVEEPSTSVDACFVMQQLQVLEDHLVSSRRELTVTEALWFMPQSDAGLNIHK
jgi:hypothetical protein